MTDADGVYELGGMSVSFVLASLAARGQRVATCNRQFSHRRPYRLPRPIHFPCHKHQQQVLQVAWHPNSQIIATVCSDRRCRVLSANMQEVDAAPDAGPFNEPVPFGDVRALTHVS
jgi:WD40 repeat protein